jgi:DNA polymerase-3 subunit gamma/tau
VVIIDEVHMLSKSAFNALLKTIEEPPAHCVFIMATTEPKKIPATIISRCQHFVFKSLSRADLEAHLSRILEAEEIEYEPPAVNILAKRGDGSVRDSMSLLGQVLALGGEKLTETDVRQVLGLAGQEFFLELMQAVYSRDIPALERMMDDLLDQGLDLGFFLRELAQSWRNMFLIQQAGEKAFDLLDLDKEFESQWADLARKFPAGFVHAAWQMVLDSQYGILKSLEPGQALELLLLNLAYLPQLLPVSRVEARGSGGEDIPRVGQQDGEEKKKNEQSPGLEPVERQETGESAEKNTAGDSGQQEEKKDFSDFLDFCTKNCRPEEIGLNALRKARAYWPSPQKLVISCGHRSQGAIFQENGRQEKLLKLCREFFGSDVQLEIELPEERAVPSKDELKEKALNDPGVKKVLDKFNARLLDVQERGVD